MKTTSLALCRPEAKTKILLVDDSKFDRVVLMRALQNCGFSHIEQAENGEEALRAAQASPPDIIILDMVMPVMDGREFCRRAKQISALKDIPVLALTGQTSGKDKEEIFACGASDYLPKPVDLPEMLARMSVHLEKNRLMKELSAFHARLEQELKTAAATQRSLLPSDSALQDLRRATGLRFFRQECFSSELAGDIWGVLPIKNGVSIYAADFTGHGVNAALNVFRFHTMLRALTRDPAFVSPYMTELNEKLCALLPTGQFATCFYGAIDLAANELRYAAAGCPDALLIRKNGEAERLSGQGFLLGAGLRSDFPMRSRAFLPGDTLVLFSDALIERPDRAGNILTEEDVAGYFSGGAEQGFESLRNHIFNAYSENWDDDLTLVACYREGM